MKLNTGRIGGLYFAAALAGVPVAASADVTISNLPGNDGTQSAGLNALRLKGMSFTTDGSAWILDSAVLRLNTTTDDNPVLTLNADAGTAPGAILATFGNPGSFGTGIDNYTFTLGTALNPNTKYWLVFGQPAGGAIDWKASSPAQTPSGLWTHSGSVFTTNGGTTWSTSSILTTYELNATVVPEPATLTLLGAGLVALAARRRRR